MIRRLGKLLAMRTGGFALVAFGILASWSPASATVCSPSVTTPCPGQALIDVTGTNNGYNEAGVYTSPYFGTITMPGTNGTSTTISTAMICDDYYNNSYLNESWVANITEITSLPLTGSTQTPTPNGSTPVYPTPLYTGTTWNNMQLDQAQEYLVVALLASDLMQNCGGQTSSGCHLTADEQTAANYGFAIWDLTNTATTAKDTNDSQGQPSVTCPYSDVGSPGACSSNSANVLGGLTNSQVTTVLGYIETAVTDVCSVSNCGGTPRITAGEESTLLANNSISNVNIYSYAGLGTSCPGGESTCAPPPQEFITVTMDEPSTPLLLGFYGICAAGLGLAFRRRIACKLS